MAVQRGPLVYAAEWPDNPGGHVRNLLLSDTSPLTTEFRPDLLNGVQVVTAKAIALSYDARGKVEHREQEATLIPYYAWANRGAGEMTVWIPNRETSARPQPRPTLASQARVSSSGGRQPRAVHDQDEPRSSKDAAAGFFHWWPKKGTSEWIQYDFEKPSTVSTVDVYWLDDTGTGEVRTPASWRVLYKGGEDWKLVEAAPAYGVELDRFNRVTFQPVTTSALRLEVSLQSQWSAGIQEWTVE